MSRRDLGHINKLREDPSVPFIKFANGGVTACVFYQSAAPTGWTQDTSRTDSMLIVTSGSGGSGGGSSAVQTGLTTTDGYTLLVADMPAHGHDVNVFSGGASVVRVTGASHSVSQGSASQAAASTGGDGSHAHAITWVPKFNSCIICTLD